MQLFGPVHISTLAVGALCCALFIRAGRRGPAGTGRCLAIAILLAQLADPFIAARFGWLRWRDSLPIELCDIASFAVAAALWTRSQRVFELAYFWGLSGTVQALLTPDIYVTFPHPEFLRFFGVHTGIVAGVLYLGPGVGMRPRPGAEWRVFGWTLLYAAAVGVIDWAIDANYMYLRSKPGGWSPLDWFGDWPWYLFGAALITVVMFALLALPYRLSRASS